MITKDAPRPSGGAKVEKSDIPRRFREEAREHDAEIDRAEALRRARAGDAVEQAGQDSFPASDPPSRTVTRGERRSR